MSMMNAQGKELVRAWEGDKLHRIATYHHPAGTVAVHVCKDVNGRYTVLRYFVIADKWVVSADASGVSADLAIQVAIRVIQVA